MNQKVIILFGVIVILLVLFAAFGSQSGKILFSSTSTIKSSISTLSVQSSSTSQATTSTVPRPMPIVKIISPQNVSTVNGNVTILVNVTSVFGIKYVQIFIGNVIYATVNSSPYSYVWNTNGFTKPEYVITAEAFDIENGTGQASVLVDIGLVQHGK